MISLRTARQTIWQKTQVLFSERIEITGSLERTLAENIKAKFDMPPFNRAAMDGYAINSEDAFTASSKLPVILKVCGEISAGEKKRKILKKRSVISIMTGAVIPFNCDSVVKLEDTEGFIEKRERKVKVFKQVSPGENISPKGEDFKKGKIILRKGKVIESAVVAMLAYLGRKKVKVFKKPEIAIVSTGNELKKPGERISGSEIYDSNSYGLYAQVLKCGGSPYILGIAEDSLNSLSVFIRKGLKYDILIISGGVSEGKYDLVVDVLRKFGVGMVFWKVAIKPGKPAFFGKKGKTLVFGLPGYPVSSYLNFENLVKVAISKMLGQKMPERFKIPAILEKDVRNRGDRDSFIRVKVLHRKGENFADPYHSQKSGVLSSIVETDGIIYLKKGAVKRKGEKVIVEILEK